MFFFSFFVVLFGVLGKKIENSLGALQKTIQSTLMHINIFQADSVNNFADLSNFRKSYDFMI